MPGKTHLTVLGFPVHIRVSVALAAVAAVVFLREVGLVLVPALAISILIHELCHSLAFRRYGTESHIVIHLFGGYSSPDAAHKLSHRQWVITALAGPVGAFLLLGLPALLLNQLDDFYFGYRGVIVRVLIYFNVYWGAINLLPIWPLDGGRVLYHSLGGNWQVTKTMTLLVSVPAAIIALQLNYRFAAIFVAFNAYQVLNSPPPGANPLADNSRVNDAVGRANSYAATPTQTRGAAGDEAIETVYRELIRGRGDRALEPLTALLASNRREHAETAAVWGRLIAEQPLLPGHTSSPLLDAVLSNDVHSIETAVRAAPVTIESGAALKVLQTRSLLVPLCARLAVDELGRERLQRLERLALDLGLVDEQIQITAALTS